MSIDLRETVTDSQGQTESQNAFESIVVETTGSSSIDVGSATVEGELMERNGEDVDVSFNWGPTGNVDANTTSLMTLSSNTTFSEDLTGLSPDTTYQFQARGEGQTSGDVVSADEVLSFTTDTIEITDGTVSSTTTSSFTVEFDVSTFTGDGDITVGFDYVDSNDGDFANSTEVLFSNNPVDGTSGPYSMTATSLTSGTNYDYRTFAEVDGVRVEGAVQTATTST